MRTSPATDLARRYQAVRGTSLALAEPLSEADCQVQSMPDASPIKWHLAHTSWFFETFVLEAHERGFRPFHTAFRALFNSYYHGVGEQHARPQRGLVTRPGLDEVHAYRSAVDERMLALLRHADDAASAWLVTLGLQHEQQHQELMLTDLLHLFSCNPLQPAYAPPDLPAAAEPVPLAWLPQDGGLVEIGHDGAGFAFDNESPRHRTWLEPHALANRLVTQAEWADFIADGGYREPRWWLAAGWDWCRSQRIEAPAYWRRDGDGGWRVFTLRGARPMQPQAPVTHVSLYEADAFAQWSAARHALPLRLPTEAEWEHAVAADAAAGIAAGHFVESGALTALPAAPARPGLLQAFGDAWQWTRSAYAPYPGFRPWTGAVGEYNGKFMANQYVLRGGSCATPRTHMRASYRNFFPADARWQFSGVRLARDLA
jgi:ergothioneine biosynthesis protein EgtB